MVGLIIAALLIGLMCLIGGVLIFSLLPIIQAVAALFMLVISLLIVAIMVLPYFFSLDDLKPDVLALVKATTGREVTLGGPITMTLWPVFGLQLQDISISNPPDFPDPIMLSAKELAVGLTLSSLMHNRLDIREIRLTGGQINLSVNEMGKGNWEIQPANDGSAGSISTKPSLPKDESTAPNHLTLQNISIKRLEVKDTNLGYDFPDGSGLDLMDINLNVSLSSHDRILDLQGRAFYNNQPVKITFRTEKPENLWLNQTTNTTLSVQEGSSNLVEMKGLLGLKSFEGALNFEIDDLANAVNIFSTTSVPAIDVIKGTAQINAQNDQVKLSDLVMKVDATNITGNALYQEKNGVTGAFDISEIDGQHFYKAFQRSIQLNGRQQTDASEAQSSIVRPSHNRSLVSFEDQPTTLNFLNRFPASITANLKGITFQKTVLGPTQLKARIKNGAMFVSLTPASLYDGTLGGDFSLDSRSFAANANYADISAEKALLVLLNKKNLTGKATGKVKITGPVHPSQPFLQSLSGDGTIALKDGKIKGVNIPLMMRKAKQLINQKNTDTDEPLSQTSETDFSELSASYTLSNGIISSSDIILLSPLLRIKGNGNANILQKTLDSHLDTSLVADLKGQGGIFNQKGLVIPLIIKGPWDHLSYQPDLRKLIVNNVGLIEQATDAIRSGQSTSLPDNAKSLIRGLFQNSPPQ